MLHACICVCVSRNYIVCTGSSWRYLGQLRNWRCQGRLNWGLRGVAAAISGLFSFSSDSAERKLVQSVEKFKPVLLPLPPLIPFLTLTSLFPSIILPLLTRPVELCIISCLFKIINMIIKRRKRFVNIFVIFTLTKKKCNEKRGRVENTSTFSVQNKQRVGTAPLIGFQQNQSTFHLKSTPLPIWLGLGQQFNIVFKHYLA